MQKKWRTCGAVDVIVVVVLSTAVVSEGPVDEGERGGAGRGSAKAGMRLRKVRVVKAQERESCMRRAWVAKRTRVERVGPWDRIVVLMEREDAGYGVSVDGGRRWMG